MALSTMSLTIIPATNYTSTLVVAGTPGISNSNQGQGPTYQLISTIANAAVGGSNELYVLASTISASGSLTINLKSFTDICNQATVALARLKYFGLWLLSATQAVAGTSGNACSSVTIGGASSPCLLNMGGTLPTQTVTNGGKYEMADGSAAGIAVTSGSENILITNNDSVNPAVCYVVFAGGTT